jgi:DNA polymerase-3 subunit epsilon
MTEDKILWFDVETTGVDTNSDRVCELSIIITDLDLSNRVDHHWYINPTKPSCKEALSKHGLTDDFLLNYPRFEEKAHEILSLIKEHKFIGGYNILKFDIPIMLEELARCDKSWNFHDHIYIDPYKTLIKHESRTLESVYKRFIGKELENAHSAASDVNATIEIFPKIINYFDIQNISEEFTIFDKSQVDVYGHLYFDENEILTFGFGKKHKGESVQSVIEKDIDYIFWVIEKADKISNYVRMMIKQMLEIYISAKEGK